MGALLCLWCASVTLYLACRTHCSNYVCGAARAVSCAPLPDELPCAFELQCAAVTVRPCALHGCAYLEIRGEAFAPEHRPSKNSQGRLGNLDRTHVQGTPCCARRGDQHLH